ncbi:MAG: hypothetical protein ACFFC1_16200, partial [Promethearchaeota archaeon]
GDKIEIEKELIKKKMVEIKKITKIALIAYSVVNLLYGIMYVFLTDIFVTDITGWTDPFHPRIFGGICLLSSIFAVIVLRKKEWDKIKLMYSYLFGLFIPTIIINITIFAIYAPTLNIGTILLFIMGLILMCILFALGIYSYIKQRG